jgi:riboflavin kinase/FMN adenylyltransferase
MKIYRSLEDIPPISHPVVTTGTFDGVHLGHQKVLSRITEIAKRNNGETLLLTFYPHPRMVLQPTDNDLKLLNTQEEKIELLRHAGLNHLVVIPSTKAFSRLSALEYVRDILVNKIGVKTLVIGYNHHFGRNREGSFEQLVEYGSIYNFSIEEIPAQEIDHLEVSSTKIRNALNEGNVKAAAIYLGRNYGLKGTIIKGKQLGKAIGFPTANIDIGDKYKLIPKNGVYAVEVNIDNKIYKGMLNIGVRPTFNTDNVISVEVHIFNLDEDIYHKTISVSFVDRIRDEKEFSGADELKKQLGEDKRVIQSLMWS